RRLRLWSLGPLRRLGLGFSLGPCCLGFRRPLCSLRRLVLGRFVPFGGERRSVEGRHEQTGHDQDTSESGERTPHTSSFLLPFHHSAMMPRSSRARPPMTMINIGPPCLDFRALSEPARRGVRADSFESRL